MPTDVVNELLILINLFLKSISIKIKDSMVSTDLVLEDPNI
jgi:hypothetical protein